MLAGVCTHTLGHVTSNVPALQELEQEKYHLRRRLEGVEEEATLSELQGLLFSPPSPLPSSLLRDKGRFTEAIVAPEEINHSVF